MVYQPATSALQRESVEELVEPRALWHDGDCWRWALPQDFSLGHACCEAVPEAQGNPSCQGCPSRFWWWSSLLLRAVSADTRDFHVFSQRSVCSYCRSSFQMGVWALTVLDRGVTAACAW